MHGKSILDKANDTFEELTAKPECFLSVQDNLTKNVKDLTKKLYDFTKKAEESSNPTNALPELIIEDFDEEQIWQEIELQNEGKWNTFLTSVSSILTLKDQIEIPIKISQNGAVEQSEDFHGFNGERDEHEMSDTTPEKKKPKKKEKKKAKETRNTKNTKSNTNKKGSIVDDNFFKLSELETFLDAQDKLEMKKTQKNKRSKKNQESSDEGSDDDESIDLFADDDTEDDMDGDEGDTKRIKYKDFFGSDAENDSGDGESSKEQDGDDYESNNDDMDLDKNDFDSDSEIDLTDIKGKRKHDKKVRFNMPQPSSDDESSNDEDNENISKQQNIENMSEFQKRQERLKKKIGHIENNMLEEKAWPMKGEVTASNRPQNSLLEHIVDFDITSRPAPIITEETTVKLQDIIIQRIKDKAWDDVERKFKPVQEVQEFKKQLVLDQEKSKLSLAQVYEQEYIKQREALDPDADDKPEEEPKEHLEIRSLMTALFTKLDALSNFHYTPKVAAPEVKIVSNMAAISMEEVAPVATSDATLLAPEEVKAKSKGDIIGKSERTETDKNRERRQKKLRQREKEKERQKKEKVLDKIRPGLGNKYSREKASRLLDKVTKQRNVEKLETIGEGKSLKSSTAFFTQLQDEVSSSIKSKLQTSKKKSKNMLSAKKMKL